MESVAPHLSAAHVTKRHDSFLALDDISFAVEGGCCLALVGESGAGKSTLLRCINRLDDMDGGRIEIGGRDVQEREPVELRRAIGYVPQDGGLLPHWRVRRNVALVPWLAGIADSSERADRALELVGLDPSELGSRWTHELSGGQRQRVAFARALAGGQSMLLLDEPFGALDAITRSDLQRMLVRLRDERPLTIILVTHDVREALLLADSVAVLRTGCLEQIASPAELRDSPATQYVAELLLHARDPR